MGHPRGPKKYHGKVVNDMKEAFNFIVGQDDCKRGKSNSPQECAAALALQKRFPNAVDIRVNRHTVIVELPRKVLRGKTGHALRDQTIRYDAGHQFQPGLYTICAVPPSEIAGRGKQHSPPDRKRGDPNSPKRRGKPLHFKREVGRPSFHFTGKISNETI